jgi:hypothetical protein
VIRGRDKSSRMEKRIVYDQLEHLFTKDRRSKEHSLGKTPKAVEAPKVRSHVLDWEQAGERYNVTVAFCFI